MLPREVAISKIKHAAEKSYGKKGRSVVESNWKAIDETIANLHQVAVPATVSSTHDMPDAVPAFAPEFVRKVTAEIMSGRGDHLPVSALPNDGTWPSATAMWDKRNLAQEIPVWDEELCIHCGKCPFVCPHSAIRSKLFSADLTKDAPPTFKHVQVKGKDFEQGLHISYQVAPEDCTGCTLCVEICPAISKVDGHKALEMRPMAPLREQERENFAFFLGLPEFDRTQLKATTIKGAMIMQPSPLGSEEASRRSAAPPSADAATGHEHNRRDPQERWTDSSAPPHSTELALRRSTASVRRAECGLVRRLQGPLRHRRGPLLPTHHQRWFQSLPASLPGAPSAALPLRAPGVRVGVP